jgi:hypothetical protein
MITQSYPKKNMKALPQRESTIYLDSTAPALKLAEGDDCIAVKSVRRPGRYYVVRFNADRQCWQCSCSLGSHGHDHLTTAREYVDQHPTENHETKAPQGKALPMPRNRIESVENALTLDVNTKSTAQQWKAIHKADKARQRALHAEYLAKVREARGQDLSSATK